MRCGSCCFLSGSSYTSHSFVPSFTTLRPRIFLLQPPFEETLSLLHSALIVALLYFQCLSVSPHPISPPSNLKMWPSNDPRTSPTYRTLYETTDNFLATLDINSNNTTISPSRFQSHTAPDYTHSWGESYLRSLRPGYGQTLSAQGYLDHLAPMMACIRAREAKIEDIFVDEARRVAVAKVRYAVTPDSDEEPLEHEAVWFCWFTEDGTRIARSEEFVDTMMRPRRAAAA